ncbi:hypothetical protein CPB84DRAFT_1789574 [Gymnopilus junonius]|uniref:Uncharacterized protein n=1 Tax=Gymnopilus junonius TaxID=109634 RepID=A0A9P5NG21_GYMJU|nr:hypothetical protein CPB84DRAFT_1789574 [Gymnopilus junonius]
MALSEAVIQPPEQSSRHAVIRHFLERCEPPMDRFFTAFINFGCTTDQYLRSIAVFTPKIRNTTLRRMLSTYVGEVGPTEMDIAILDDYFISYFS